MLVLFGLSMRGKLLFSFLGGREIVVCLGNFDGLVAVVLYIYIHDI